MALTTRGGGTQDLWPLVLFTSCMVSAPLSGLCLSLVGNPEDRSSLRCCEELIVALCGQRLWLSAGELLQSMSLAEPQLKGPWCPVGRESPAFQKHGHKRG